VFSVADTVGKAVRLGGRMLAGPAREAQGATGALLEDPTGAAFGVSELPPEMVDLRAP
jgi:predicted enzyme related to lactoylglutathione lyase